MHPGMYDGIVGIENHHNGMHNKIAFHLMFHVVHRRLLVSAICACLDGIYPALMVCTLHVCTVRGCLLEELF